MAMLTPQLVEQARELRANGVGWHTVSKRTGISEYILRVEIEPHFQEHRRAQHQKNSATRKQLLAKHLTTMRARRRSITKAAPHYVATLERAPPEVLRERDERETAKDRRTLAQILLGDPIPGYSALDAKERR
jgi:hypothetical protein